MLRRPFPVIGILLFVAYASPALAASRPLRAPAPAPPADEVVLLVREPAAEPGTAPPEAVHPALESALSRLLLAPARAQTRSLRGGYSVLVLRSAQPGFVASAAAAELRAEPDVIAAIPNVRLRLYDTLPNDPMRSLQWYVDNGDSADIELPGAWDIGKGNAATAIGIMDTGVDLGHPDLASKIWTNAAEAGGATGVDDDGNGHVDDLHGWDFGDDDSDPNPTPVFEDISGGLGLITDIAFHGSFVAGIAAAATNNAVGISGASWNCTIVPLKVSDVDGVIRSDAVAGAFAYATDAGLPVLNMSLGGPGDPGVPEFFQALVDAADAAGVLSVAAAGNDGANVLSYPAACSKVLAVGATDDLRARAEFSNFGSWVDCAAPGATMWSAIHRNYLIDDLSQLVYEIFFGWDTVQPYMYGDGTSFACPLAAGVCALVRAQRPALTPAQTLAHIVATGDPVAFDQPIGTKVNAWRALSTPTLAVGSAGSTALALAPPRPQPARGAAALDFTLPAAGHARIELFDPAGRRVRVLADRTFEAGANSVRFDGRDAAGTTLPAGVYLVRIESGGRIARARMVYLGR